MTKKELIALLAHRTGVTLAAAESQFDEMTKIISDTLAEGGEISFPDIGKLKVATTAERNGRNPATGAAIQIPASKRIKFTVSKTLKDRVK